jgi:hypothetical protein
VNQPIMSFTLKDLCLFKKALNHVGI